MTASSHFMTPISAAASRPRTARTASTDHARTFASSSQVRSHAADWEELDAARRRASLLALLAIYAAGLGLVVMLYEGEDIGVVLSAFFAHALYMAARGISATMRSQRIATRRGTLVIQSRVRLIPLLATR